EKSGSVLESIYNKPFESVPLVAKSLSVTKNRLWLANYTDGYDTPSRESIVVEFNIEKVGFSTADGVRWPSNSRHKVGVVFYDNEGRSCGVVDGWTLDIPANVFKYGSSMSDYYIDHLKY